MTKKIETVFIVLIYALFAYLNAMFFYFFCQFDYGANLRQCMATGISRLTAYGIFIFGIPTYHFGLKGGLKMGVAFLCSGFLWLLLWELARKAFEPGTAPDSVLRYVIAMPFIVLYLFAYRSEWRKRKIRIPIPLA